MMDLKEFIKETLISVCEAVKEAKEIKPGIAATPRGDSKIATSMAGNPMTMIEFDIAVTVSEATSSNASAKAGISVMSMFKSDLDATQGNKAESSRISRIKMCIPVAF